MEQIELEKRTGNNARYSSLHSAWKSLTDNGRPTTENQMNSSSS